MPVFQRYIALTAFVLKGHSACEAFKQLITTLFEHKINDIGFFNYFNRDDGPRMGHYLTGEESEEMARHLAPLINKAIGCKLSNETGPFEFCVCHEEFALPRDLEYFNL